MVLFITIIVVVQLQSTVQHGEIFVYEREDSLCDLERS